MVIFSVSFREQWRYGGGWEVSGHDQTQLRGWGESGRRIMASEDWLNWGALNMDINCQWNIWLATAPHSYLSNPFLPLLSVVYVVDNVLHHQECQWCSSLATTLRPIHHQQGFIWQGLEIIPIIIIIMIKSMIMMMMMMIMILIN